MNSLFSHRFATSQEAVDACQSLAHQEGFSVRIRTSKASTVYIVCSREGKPEIKHDSKKRSRNSERCYCGWRIVLMFNADSTSQLKWEFRAGKTMVHNHTLGSERAFTPYFVPVGSMIPMVPSHSIRLTHSSEFTPLSTKQGLNITLPPIRSLFRELGLKDYQRMPISPYARASILGRGPKLPWSDSNLSRLEASTNTQKIA